MPFGPQAGSGYLSPTPQQPMPMDPYQQWSMQNQASHEAMMQAMGGGFDQQYRGNLQGLGMSGAKLGNTLAGNPMASLLRPIGSAVKSAASSLLGNAPQSYTVGGTTTLGANSVAQAGLSNGEQAAVSAVNDASPSILGVAGQGLGLAALGYGTYSGFHSGAEAIRRLHEAQSYGLSPEQESKLKMDTFRSGAQGSAVGALGGGLAGASYGPWGIAAGAALGGAPGAVQAWQSADDSGDRWEMQKQFQRNPFRR